MTIDRQKVIDAAQKLAAKGQLDKALVEYMRVVKENPSDLWVLLKIGDLQDRNGDKDDAVATYSRVASSYDRQGFFEKAIAVYTKILSIQPNQVELYSRLAELNVKRGRVPEALANLDGLATRYAKAGQDDKVIGVLRQMTQIDPTSVPAHIKLAELLSKLGKGEDAAKEFEAGSTLLKEAGRLDDWAKVAERLLFHRANDAVLARELGRHYLARQDVKRALPKLQVCFKANAKDTETLELLAAAFRELGQLPKTISVLKEIARIHQENGQSEKRNEMYRRVLELAPNDAEAREALRGSSRLSRRPTDGTGTGETAVPRKSSTPGIPAPAAAPKKPSSPAIPVPTAQVSSPPEIVEEEAVEEIVVEDSDEEAVIDLQPSAAKSLPKAPPEPQNPPGAPAALPLSRPRVSTGEAKVGPPPAAAKSADPATELTRLIGEAEIFLKYGLKQKAVGHLNQALKLDHNSIEVLARLRDIHAELGDAVSSAQHSFRLAEIVAPSDPETALAEVTHALQLDPSNLAAMDLYQRLTGAAPAEFAEVHTAENAYPQDGFGDAGYEHTTFDASVGGDADEQQADAGPPSARDIEEGLDEAEFFVTQGLYDEARDTLQGLLEAHPGHPLVIERFEELEAMVQAQAMPAEDQTFALAEKLAEEVSAATQGGDPHFNAGGEMIDVETVFAQFKKGVEKTVSADDSDTHYDLGIAYKEMGLTDDAVSEFKIAAQSARKACLAEMMIGLCFSERGDLTTAIEHFKRSLQTPNKTEREEMAIYFELGNAYEAVGDLAEAMYFFQKVEKRDASFRGIRQRVQRLAAHVTSGARQQPEMDDVDRAFDELLKG